MFRPPNLVRWAEFVSPALNTKDGSTALETRVMGGENGGCRLPSVSDSGVTSVLAFDELGPVVDKEEGWLASVLAKLI